MWNHPLENENQSQFPIEIIGSLKDIDEATVINLIILNYETEINQIWSVNFDFRRTYSISSLE